MNNWQTTLNQLRQDARVPMVLTAVFAILSLIIIIHTINTLNIHHTRITKTQAPPAQPLEQITDLHLFGIYSTNLDSLPLTQLQLTLEGTVVSLSAPQQSYALITTAGRPTKVYRVGDALPGNATISHIEKHYIVLNDNGALEKLAMPIETITP